VNDDERKNNSFVVRLFCLELALERVFAANASPKRWRYKKFIFLFSTQLADEQQPFL
jgi:hypothetical protein